MAAYDNEVNRSLGRLESALSMALSHLENLRTEGLKRDDAIASLASRVHEIEDATKRINAIDEKVTAVDHKVVVFEAMLRDSKMVSKGMIIGLMLASALVGVFGEAVIGKIIALFTRVGL